jgi:hypothetical protein
MSRSFKSSPKFVLGLVLASMFGVATLSASLNAGTETVDFTTTAQAAPLDYDQTHYRRNEGVWQLVDESCEKPYV